MEVRTHRMLGLAAVVIATLIVGCAGMRSHGQRRSNVSAVVGRTWQWESTRTGSETTIPPVPEQYTIQLGDGGKVVARLDCNHGGGTYQITDGQITFGPMATTRMACPPGSLADRFAKELREVRSFYVESNDLYLEIPGGGTMRFSPT